MKHDYYNIIAETEGGNDTEIVVGKMLVWSMFALKIYFSDHCMDPEIHSFQLHYARIIVQYILSLLHALLISLHAPLHIVYLTAYTNNTQVI